MPEHLTFTEHLLRNARVDDTTGCWNWIGVLNVNGYGVVTVKGHRQSAHRWVYENLRTPIPDDFQIDHLCRNRRCVNPSHLEAVTAAVNVNRQRGDAGLHATCKRGHSREHHTRITGSGKKACRECQRIVRYQRQGLPIRFRRSDCQFCQRSIGEANLSRHEARCFGKGATDEVVA